MIDQVIESIELNRNGGKPLADQLAAQFEERIISGTLSEESRLPSGLELSRQMGVAYCTMTSALKKLAQKGLIKRTARGTFIREAYRAVKTKRIVMVYLNREERDRIYKRRVAEGIRSVLREPDYSLSTLIEDDFRDGGTSWWQEAGAAGNFDAIILDKEGTYDADTMQLLKTTKVPCLLFNSVLSTMYDSTVRIMPDFGAGYFAVLEHLVGLGHRKIAVLLRHGNYGPDGILEKTWRNTLAMEGIDASPEWLIPDVGHDSSAISAEIDRLLALDNRPTALVCADDIIAYHSLDHLKRRGIDVPGEISLTGCGGLDIAEIVTPRLTTVDIPLYEIGNMIGHKLVSIINGTLEKEMIFVPVVFRDGGSTGPTETDD